MNVPPKRGDKRAIKRNAQRGRVMFLVLACGQVVSALGTGLAIFAIQWELWTRLESGVALAAFWVFVAIPYIVLGPIAGVCVDRWDRRKILLGSDLFSGLITAVAVLGMSMGHSPVPMLYAVVLAVSCCNSFHAPALQSSIPRLIPPSRLARANSLLEFGMQGSRILAPAFGGVVLAAGWSVVHLLPLAAVSFLVSALSLVFVRIPSPKGDQGREEADPKPKAPLLSDISSGVRFLRSQRELFWLMMLAAVVNFLGSGLNVLIPQLVTQVFQGGSRLFGMMEASLSGGALFGSVILLVWGDLNEEPGGS